MAVKVTNSKTVPGLVYIQEFITPEEEQSLIKSVDSETWNHALSRRTQHYGYTYDYKRKKINHDEDYLGPLPKWSETIVDRIMACGLFKQTPSQMIVNEYEPGQGIAAHTDAMVFGPVIASLSLGSDIIMRFENLTIEKYYSQLLERRSLIVLQGPARYQWTHEILKKKSEVFDGRVLTRDRRISLTFRTVDLNF